MTKTCQSHFCDNRKGQQLRNKNKTEQEMEKWKSEIEENARDIRR